MYMYTVHAGLTTGYTRAWPTASERSYAEFGPFFHDWKGLEGGCTVVLCHEFLRLVVLSFL
jgi:hypothetical protein